MYIQYFTTLENFFLQNKPGKMLKQQKRHDTYFV